MGWVCVWDADYDGLDDWENVNDGNDFGDECDDLISEKKKIFFIEKVKNNQCDFCNLLVNVLFNKESTINNI